MSAPLSEPTDPRIAEICELLKEATASLPMLDPREIFLTAQERRDGAIVTLKRRVMVDIPYLLERLEQVTAERDAQFTAAQQAGDALLASAMKANALLEAAEATIASLLEALAKHDAAVPLSTHTKAWKDGARWAFEKVRASLPASAVSRTAERPRTLTPEEAYGDEPHKW